MVDRQQQDLSEVGSLLATRQKISEWLRKLDEASTRTPPSVRDRVRADYQGRLSQVVEQLRAHSDIIASTLNGLRAQAEEYEQLRTEEQEVLSEAELRFAVGEFGETDWKRVEAEAGDKIAGLDAELERLASEIGRLEDVQAQMAPSPAAPTRPAPAAEAPALEVVRSEPRPTAPALPTPMEAPEAPRFVARGGRPRESGPARAIPFPAREPAPPREPAAAREPAVAREPAPSALDELTFLKSMTLDSRGAAPAAGTAAPAVVEGKTERQGQVVPKTLKCGECGALNRPTEWYCERCGGELAAV